MLEAFADEVVYNPHARPLTAEEVAALLPGVDGYIAGLDTISAEVLADAPASLKVISRYGAGVDRVDLAAARARGIVVTNTPGTNSTAVCELAFGLMLSLARHIPQLDAAVKSGGWPRTSGMELAGRTLGIVGCGAIGKKLAVRAKAFEMDVIAYDPYFDAALRRARHKAGDAGRADTALGCDIAACAADGTDPAHDRRGTDRRDEAGHADHQHRAGRAYR